MKLFVYHTPELVPDQTLPDCAVVIDVLRATTTIATALSAGAEAVQTFSDIDLLNSHASAWPQEKCVKVGERGGQKITGFDLDNSPLNCTENIVKAKRLFLTTTNGTRALQKVAKAPVVITAAQINRQAIVNYLLENKPNEVWLVGSGWQGTYSIEDTACAGAIIAGILQHTQISLLELSGNDEVVGAYSLYQQWQSNLLEMFYNSSHGNRLVGLKCLEDLEYCAKTDILDIIPIQTELGVLSTN